MKNAVNGFEGEKDKLFNFRPALFAAFFLVLGIVFSYFRILHGASYRWLFVLLPVFLLPLLFSRDMEDGLSRLCGVLLLAVFFGIGSISFRSQIIAFQEQPAFCGEYVVVGEVETRKSKEERVALILKNVYVGEEKVGGRLTAYLPIYEAGQIQVGDKVLLRGKVTTDTSLVNSYGFKSAEITKKSCYLLKSEEGCMKVGRTKDPFLLVRSKVEEVVYAGMDETPAALSLALLTGDVSGVDGELMENMRYGGIAHIFAVSGLNVGALYACCLFLFSKTPLKRTPKAARFLLLVGILLFYSGICGFSASVVRAAITCAVCYFTKLFGVGNDLLNALGVAAILILLLSPAELMGVGFQLSFLACLGLFLLTRPIDRIFDGIKNAYAKRFPRKLTKEEEKLLARGDTLPPSVGERAWRAVSGLLSASIAAQAFTFPALIIHFGYVSGWALLLNFFFVPVTDALFTLLLGLVTLACCLPTAFATALLYLPSIAWSTSVLIFECIDFSTFGLFALQISMGACVCYYGGILFLTDKLNVSPRLRKYFAYAFWTAFAVGLHLCNL